MNSASSNLRIVIDTNVFISALVFGGKPRQVIDLLADDLVTIAMSEAIMTEIRRIIVNKFPDFLEDLMKVEKLLEEDAEWVKLGMQTVSVSRNPDDNKFLETALAAQSQYIISGDKDLLDLKQYNGFKIVSVVQFLEIFSRA